MVFFVLPVSTRIKNDHDDKENREFLEVVLGTAEEVG